MRPNPITLIDGYKLDHRRQYPPGTRRVYSNLTPRSSRIEGQESVVFLGLQYFLRRYLIEEMTAGFFEQPREMVLHRYRRRVDGYLGANAIDLDHIAALHDLGYVPLRFCAFPEGTPVPLRVPMLTVENTHPDFAWLVNYIETLLCNILWLPCTSATTAWRYRQLLDGYAAQTGGDPGFVDWQGHDFSFRGLAGVEAAQLSGMGHLASFLGTDTIPALDLIEDYYYGDEGAGPLGGSVPATEHSVMCAGGAASEIETFRRLLELYPAGIVSVVSDTWDLWHVLTSILPQLRDQIMAREGKLVIRPDSGDPIKILCGDPEAEAGTPAHQGVVSLLWQVFGGTVTDAGYRQLDPHIGAIYGDSITHERARAICERLAANRFASTNVVLGIGSYTYQYVTRDTYGFAMKATHVDVDGEGRDLFKRPVTDSGTKFSATGRLAVLADKEGRPALRERATPEQEAASMLQPVWVDGRFERTETFAAIRRRLREASGVLCAREVA